MSLDVWRVACEESRVVGFLDAFRVAIEEGREVTPQAEALLSNVAVAGRGPAPASIVAVANQRDSAPRDAAEWTIAGARSLRCVVAGAQPGLGFWSMLLSSTLAAARTAGDRSMRRLSASTGDEVRQQILLSIPASSNRSVERTGVLRHLSATGAQGKSARPSLGVASPAPAAHLRR